MIVVCGVCNAAPPKYKCPTCQLRYCSLACFKPHKATHASDSTANADVLIPHEAASVQPPQPPQPTYTIFNLRTNPAFLEILKRFPSLKSQLADIWQITLPPSAPTNADQPYHVRGGRQVGRFKQEKADEHAACDIGRLRDDESEEGEGLREFLKLLASLPSPVQQQQQLA